MHEPQPIDQGNIDLFTWAAARPCLLEFWAPWCAPCLGMAPAIRALASEMGGRLQVGSVDIDHSPDIAARFGVVSTPTFVLLVRGEPVAQVAGFLPSAMLRQWVQEALKAAGAL